MKPLEHNQHIPYIIFHEMLKPISLKGFVVFIVKIDGQFLVRQIV